MSTQPISRRYACALFDLIREGTDLASGLESAAQAASVEEVRKVLVSPSVPAESKAAIIDKVCGGLSPEIKRLVGMLCQRGKAQLLPEINAMVVQMVRESESEIVASVTSACELDADSEKKIAAALTRSSGRNVKVEVDVDASLLGGVVIRIGDRQIDHSVKTRLDNMRRAIVG